jgi:hypothetical protein
MMLPATDKQIMNRTRRASGDISDFVIDILLIGND